MFSLASSEILIVNIWEHQVGLYQGANMGLLKTVFEVNLGLFGKKAQDGCVIASSLSVAETHSLIPVQADVRFCFSSSEITSARHLLPISKRHSRLTLIGFGRVWLSRQSCKTVNWQIISISNLLRSPIKFLQQIDSRRRYKTSGRGS